MAFSIGGYLIGRVTAQNQGITDEAVVSRLSLFGGLLGSTPIGLVMTTVIARREAEDVAPAPIALPSSPQIEVPDVVNKPIAEAQSILEALGLQVQQQAIVSTSTPVNLVSVQTPAAKSPVAPGTTVTLLVSAGSTVPGTDMPNVIGKAQADAEAALRGLGLSVTAFRVESDAPSGTVVEQSPDPEEPIATGNKARLLISTGALTQIDLVDVPNVVELPFNRANDLLKTQGFIVKRTDTAAPLPNTAPPAETVISQSPPAGNKVAKGAEVTLTVFLPPGNR